MSESGWARPTSAAHAHYFAGDAGKYGRISACGGWTVRRTRDLYPSPTLIGTPCAICKTKADKEAR